MPLFVFPLLSKLFPLAFGAFRRLPHWPWYSFLLASLLRSWLLRAANSDEEYAAVWKHTEPFADLFLCVAVAGAYHGLARHFRGTLGLVGIGASLAAGLAYGGYAWARGEHAPQVFLVPALGITTAIAWLWHEQFSAGIPPNALRHAAILSAYLLVNSAGVRIHMAGNQVLGNAVIVYGCAAVLAVWCLAITRRGEEIRTTSTPDQAALLSRANRVAAGR